MSAFDDHKGFLVQGAPHNQNLPGDSPQKDALQRLLDMKGPMRQKNAQDTPEPFLITVNEVLRVMDEVEEGIDGWLSGTISGQCWQEFMEGLRCDLLTHLQQYRQAAADGLFSPASLSDVRRHRQMIEQNYIKYLAALYQQAANQYKSLSG